jgi:hypothetical protein
MAEEAKKKTPQNTEIPFEYLQSVGSGAKARPLFEYLWKNERATFDQLRKTVWDSVFTEEGTIIKAIERLEDKLTPYPELQISRTRHEVILTKKTVADRKSTGLSGFRQIE